MCRCYRSTFWWWYNTSLCVSEAAREHPAHLLSSTPWFSGIFGQSDSCVYGAYRSVCVHGSQARHTLTEPRFWADQAAETPGAGGTVAAALPSGRRAPRVALDATLRERWGRRVYPYEDTARQGV